MNNFINQLPDIHIPINNLNNNVNNFINIIKQTYDNILLDDINLFTKNEIIKDILFFKYTKKILSKEEFKNNKYFAEKIISNDKFYFKLKNILIFCLELDENEKKNILHDFKKLEKLGFNSFSSYNNFNINVKNILEKEMNYMINKNYNVKYILNKEGFHSPILSIEDNFCSLHTGIKKLIELFNISHFMSYDAFSTFNDEFTDVQIYYSNSNIKNIYLFKCKDKLNFEADKLLFLCKIATVTIKSLSILTQKNRNDTQIQLILFLSDSAKLFPLNGQILSDLNVNSADTISFSDPLIRIYRTEELIKIFIHECIHCSKFETVYGTCPNNSFNVLSTHNYKICNLKFNETITETLTEFINTVIYSHISKKNFNKYFNKELLFGFIQTAKIFHHFGFNTVDEFLQNNSDKKIIQNTAAFEYHILKSILMLRINDFIDIFIGYQNNIKGCDMMMKIILDEMNENNYKNIIDQLIKNLNKLESNLKKTFRMTVIEIQFNKQIISNQKGGGNFLYKYFKYKIKYLDLQNSL